MRLTQGEAARQIGVDPTTLARWEREKEPWGKFTPWVERFLAAEKARGVASGTRTA